MSFADRLHTVRAFLRQEHVPVAFVFDPCNICYLTGYWTILSGIPGTETLLAIPESSPPWLAVPGLEVTLAREQCPEVDDIRYLRPAETCVGGQRKSPQTVTQLVARALAAVPPGSSIGIDVSLLRTDRYQALADVIRGHPVRDLSLLAALRASKDTAEQERIRASARIVSKAAAAIAQALRPGVTEDELAAEAVRVIWAHGGTISHLVVASGPRAALPHALPTAKAVAPGEFVVVDVGVYRDNYWAEIARTFVVGAPTAEQSRLLTLVAQAQAAARRALKPGVPACDVDEAARAVLRDAGFDDGVYIHSTGHGLGIMGPDAPAVAPHNTAPIPINAALTIEPGLYFPGSGGIRIEDSFIVAESGLECLTE